MPAPTHADLNALTQQGLALHRQGKLAEAQDLYRRVLEADPRHFDALNLLGTLALQAREFATAEVLIGQALAINPSVYAPLSNRGTALLELNRFGEALASFEAALAIEPNRADAHYNRANALLKLERVDDATASYDRVLSLKADHADAWNNRGTALLLADHAEAALASYGRALALDPARAEFYYNRGNALRDLHQLEAATADYDRALALKPDDAMALNNRGNALTALRRFDEALASFDKALTRDATAVDVHNNRGVALMGMKRLDAALASCDHAIALNPNYADAWTNRGHILVDLKRLDDAATSYDRALALDPDHPLLLGVATHTRMKLCDWSGLAERLDKLRGDIGAGRAATVPLPVLALFDDPALHRQATTRYVDTKFRSAPALGTPARADKPARIRLGYFSGDYCNHPVAHLIVDLLEAHDRTQFEVFAFSFGPQAPDDMQRRIAAAVDTFIDVRDESDVAIAGRARDLGIDIAIDLTGHTQFARTGVFAQRCAPVQMHHLGYLGTMGADFIDYIVADDTVIPPTRYGDYVEKVLTLPHSHEVNGTTRKSAARTPTRREVGLPEDGFIFCCFNNSYKICPPTFDRWMRILKAVEGSVLWLVEETPTVSRNLRKEAEARGVDPARLIFAPRVPIDQYLARQPVADLFLDTLPYNAGTTASDALWMELPVLTCPGSSFASRVAASLLTALDMPELIATSGDDYEAIAVGLAHDPAKLAALRRKLAAHRLSKPLFNAQLFARHIEAAYTAIHARQRAGLPPDHIRIAAISDE